MSESSLAERVLVWALRRLYRFLFALLALGFGLLWVWVGLAKALLVAALTLLGYLVGKWLDEGRPDGGLSSRIRRFFSGG